MRDVRLALLRHGKTEWNRAGRIQGRTDIPLDCSAQAELKNLRLPQAFQYDVVTSSPLVRAQLTASLITNQTPRVENALLEMDWGDWEGLAGIDLKADATSGYRDLEEWGWDFQPPKGETPRDVQKRLLPWLSNLDRNTVAVTHIGVMRVCLAIATGWDFSGDAPFKIKRNRLFVMNRISGKWSFETQAIRLEHCE